MIPIYAQRIREVRQNLGLTQTDFAHLIGTTKNQLSKYELGTQDTPTKIIIAVCTVFKVDANWLLGLKSKVQYSQDQLIPLSEIMKDYQEPVATFRYHKLEAFDLSKEDEENKD